MSCTFCGIKVVVSRKTAINTSGKKVVIYRTCGDCLLIISGPRARYQIAICEWKKGFRELMPDPSEFGYSPRHDIKV